METKEADLRDKKLRVKRGTEKNIIGTVTSSNGPSKIYEKGLCDLGQGKADIACSDSLHVSTVSRHVDLIQAKVSRLRVH